MRQSSPAPIATMAISKTVVMSMFYPFLIVEYGAKIIKMRYIANDMTTCLTLYVIS